MDVFWIQIILQTSRESNSIHSNLANCLSHHFNCFDGMHSNGFMVSTRDSLQWFRWQALQHNYYHLLARYPHQTAIEHLRLNFITRICVSHQWYYIHPIIAIHYIVFCCAPIAGHNVKYPFSMWPSIVDNKYINEFICNAGKLYKFVNNYWQSCVDLSSWRCWVIFLPSVFRITRILYHRKYLVFDPLTA